LASSEQYTPICDQEDIELRPTVLQQPPTFESKVVNPMPVPITIMKKAASGGWSDSDPDSNSKLKSTDENYMPKSLAVRGKFVFDPEHGGGRRRRDKHLPKQK
jgi:hypothetical protein